MIQELAKLQSAARNEGIEVTTVGVAVWREGKLLLVQRASNDFLPDLWELPGGHIEPGESILEAARRELLEETGYELRRVVELIDAFDYEGETGWTREWNVVAEVDASHEPILTEHQSYVWVDRAEAMKLPMSDEMRSTVEAAFSRHREQSSRIT